MRTDGEERCRLPAYRDTVAAQERRLVRAKRDQEAVVERLADERAAIEHHGTELAALLHRGEHVGRAQRQLRDFIRDLLVEGAAAGDLREDVAPDVSGCSG